ncbi:hypothetical protein ITJ66_10325 [Plantibacter sp. VKM Ac-2885]|uniref:hypothetical protein n=1 Tax=unclassified Plantibacter TaxID=2624265 RepID=UPI0017815D26|nr:MULTISPECIES: hypothetical protein [unclassified Plantibacter]MBD8515718.1 hypothetical protein [Plantibacter sp. CFBP 8804]MBF4512878.1 hypothetical protein [Plantibacter sp. VKM Ac-2885]
MSSTVPVIRRSPFRAAGRALLVTAALSASAVLCLVGAGAAVAASAPAPLTLRDTTGAAVTSGDARAVPSFGSAVLAAGCPADADDAARLSVTAGGVTVVTSSTVTVAAGQPVEVPMAISFQEVVDGGVEQGDATLALECLVLESGIPSSVVTAATLPVTFAAGTWSVPGAQVEPVPPTVTPTAAPPSGGSGAGAIASPGPSATARPSADGDLALTGWQLGGAGVVAAGLLAGGAALLLRRRLR